MSTETEANTNPEPVTDPVTESVEEPAISNADAKSLPWVKDMASELAHLKKEKADNAAAVAKTEQDAKIKKAAEEGRFEEAQKLFDQQMEQKDKTHAAELQTRDLKTSLLQANFKNKTFIEGAISGYNSESGTIDEYVAALAADEANAAFLTTAQLEASKPSPPGKPALNGGKTNWDEVKNMELNGTPEQKKKAREQIAEHRRQTGEYPYKL